MDQRIEKELSTLPHGVGALAMPSRWGSMILVLLVACHPHHQGTVSANLMDARTTTTGTERSVSARSPTIKVASAASREEAFQQFLQRVTLPLLDGGNYGAAERYLDDQDVVRRAMRTKPCRSFSEEFSAVKSALKTANFSEDFEILKHKQLIPNEVRECRTYIRIIPHKVYEAGNQNIPPGNWEQITDVVRICSEISLEMNSCFYATVVFATRWTEGQTRQNKLQDRHLDALIEEVTKRLKDFLGEKQ